MSPTSPALGRRVSLPLSGCTAMTALLEGKADVSISTSKMRKVATGDSKSWPSREASGLPAPVVCPTCSQTVSTWRGCSHFIGLSSPRKITLKISSLLLSRCCTNTAPCHLSLTQVTLLMTSRSVAAPWTLVRTWLVFNTCHANSLPFPTHCAMQPSSRPTCSASATSGHGPPALHSSGPELDPRLPAAGGSV